MLTGPLMKYVRHGEFGSDLIIYYGVGYNKKRVALCLNSWALIGPFSARKACMKVEPACLVAPHMKTTLWSSLFLNKQKRTSNKNMMN